MHFVMHTGPGRWAIKPCRLWGLHSAQRNSAQQKWNMLQGERVHKLAGAWVLGGGGGGGGGGRADAEGSWRRNRQ